MLVQPVKRRFTVEEYHRMGEVHRGPVGESYSTVEIVPRTGRLSPAALPDAQIAVAEIL